jgi:hypothetical protein
VQGSLGRKLEVLRFHKYGKSPIGGTDHSPRPARAETPDPMEKQLKRKEAGGVARDWGTGLVTAGQGFRPQRRKSHLESRGAPHRPDVLCIPRGWTRASLTPITSLRYIPCMRQAGSSRERVLLSQERSA